MNGNADLWPSVLLTAGTAGVGAGPHCCWESAMLGCWDAALLEERILRQDGPHARHQVAQVP